MQVPRSRATIERLQGSFIIRPNDRGKWAWLVGTVVREGPVRRAVPPRKGGAGRIPGTGYSIPDFLKIGTDRAFGS